MKSKFLMTLFVEILLQAIKKDHLLKPYFEKISLAVQGYFSWLESNDRQAIQTRNAQLEEELKKIKNEMSPGQSQLIDRIFEMVDSARST